MGTINGEALMKIAMKIIENEKKIKALEDENAELLRQVGGDKPQCDKYDNLKLVLNQSKKESTVSRVIKALVDKNIDHNILRLHPSIVGKRLAEFSRKNNIFIRDLTNDDTQFTIKIFDSRAWYNLYDINLDDLFE